MKLAFVSSASDFMLEDKIASLIGLIASKIMWCPPEVGRAWAAFLLPCHMLIDHHFGVLLRCARTTTTIRQTPALALCG